MNDSLFSENEIPASVPKWKQLADQHGIQTVNRDKFRGIDSYHFGYQWMAERQMSEESPQREYAETEREAGVTLLHTLKLDGWETVSVEP